MLGDDVHVSEAPLERAIPVDGARAGCIVHPHHGVGIGLDRIHDREVALDQVCEA